MYFKIDPDSALFEQFKKIREDFKAVRLAAHEMKTELGAISYTEPWGVFAGGIAGFQFPNREIPKGWKRPKMGFTFPVKARKNKDLLRRIAALPVVEASAVSSILNWDPHGAVPLKMIPYPIIGWKDDFFTIKIPDGAIYQPVEGMIEILYSEWAKNNS